jgi:O-6-methylguanine DNA methyltransferase
MALPEGFDAEVYSVVAQIPAGRVTTYGQIARLIGMPGYARRVGHALAAAPAGLPCHRVVGANGSLTGYAGGIEKKIKLLELEGVDMSGFFIPQKGTAL